MIYLKEYYNYDNKVAEICKKFGIENWTIRDGFVDVDSNVILIDRRLDKLPLKFGRVSGDFDCYLNSLTSLKGAPTEVGGDLICSHNNLTSLEGAPKEVGGDLICSHNNLTSLEGAPKEVGGDFYCNNNNLTSLEGGPKWVGGSLYCENNKLKTLEFFPTVVGDIEKYNNDLPLEIVGRPLKSIKRIISEQDFYEIWRDGKLFRPRFEELIKDLGI